MSVWDDDGYLARVIDRYKAGEGCAEIARSLGLSRNAVTAKLDRGGALNRRGASPPRPRTVVSRPRRAPTPKPLPTPTAAELAGLRAPKVTRDLLSANAVNFRKPAALKIAGRGTVFEEAEAQAPRVELRPEAFAPLPGIQPIPFIDRNWSHCARPVGGEGAEMLCCGAQRDGEGPYCGAHRARSTQAARPGSPRTASELARSLRRHIA